MKWWPNYSFIKFNYFCSDVIYEFAKLYLKQNGDHR